MAAFVGKGLPLECGLPEARSVPSAAHFEHSFIGSSADLSPSARDMQETRPTKNKLGALCCKSRVADVLQLCFGDVKALRDASWVRVVLGTQASLGPPRPSQVLPRRSHMSARREKKFLAEKVRTLLGSLEALKVPPPPNLGDPELRTVSVMGSDSG